MSGGGALVMLGASLIFYVIGMVGVLVGMTGNAWFVSDETIIANSDGLIKECIRDHCVNRESLFKFEDDLRFGEGWYLFILSKLYSLRNKF